jgi:integrase
MARPPLPVGTFGKVQFLVTRAGSIRARVKYRDFDGVVRPVSRFGASRAKAEAALKQALRDRYGTGAGEITGETLLRRVAEVWLSEIEARDLASSTKELYRDVVERRLNPGVGALRVREVSVATAERFIKTVLTNTGASTAKTTRTVLSGVLGLAVRHGALARNPVRELSRISHPRKTVRTLSHDEAVSLLDKVRTDPEAARLDLPDLIELMLGTGVRVGEACALRWAAVDLEGATVEVNATTVRSKMAGLHIQEQPKSAAGRRIIALPTYVVAMLSRRAADPTLTNDAGVVFPSPYLQLRDRSNTTADLRRVLDNAGFEWVTSHTFRKTVATWLDEAGQSARQIADQLGHSRPSLTQDVYMGRKVIGIEAAKILQKGRDGGG